MKFEQLECQVLKWKMPALKRHEENEKIATFFDISMKIFCNQNKSTAYRCQHLAVPAGFSAKIASQKNLSQVKITVSKIL